MLDWTVHTCSNYLPRIVITNTVLIHITLQIRALEDTSCTEDADDCCSVMVDLNCVDEFPVSAFMVSLHYFRPMECLPIHRYAL